jgi:hypothetical protein
LRGKRIKFFHDMKNIWNHHFFVDIPHINTKCIEERI